MSKNYDDNMDYIPVETSDTSISIGKIEENTQVTVNDTGWSEEEKERMRKAGYDGCDMVRAWYS